MDEPKKISSRIFWSEYFGEIALALSQAQGEFKPIERKSNNPFFKSKYADLNEIRTGVQESLTKYNLALVQLMHPDTDNVVVESVLMHKSSQYIKSLIKIKPVKTDPQGMGSAITYARRYGLSALLGVATEDEDDGNSASDVEKDKKKKSEPKPAEVKPEPVKEQPQTGTPDHFCKDHNVPFKLMTGKTDPNQHWYSHKAPDGKWCNEKQSAPDASKQTDVVVDDAPLFPDDKPTEKPITEARKFDWQKVTKLAGKMGLKTVAQIPKALGIAKSGDWHGTEEQALDKIYEFAQLNGYQGAPWREIEL